MVQSTARNVDEYLGELPEERRAALRRLGKIPRRVVPEFAESIEYRLPYYRGPGGAGVAFASPRQHIAVYLAPRVVAAHANELAAYDVGKSCVRATSADAIDGPRFERLIRETKG